jgi:hypothetical protein
LGEIRKKSIGLCKQIRWLLVVLADYWQHLRTIFGNSVTNFNGVQNLPSYVTTDGSINRKVAFASAGAAIGSVVSIFLVTFLLNLPFLANVSAEDVGTLKASLTSAVTALVTLFVGYQTRPGARDGIKEEEEQLFYLLLTLHF